MESVPIAKPKNPKEEKIENKEKTISLTIDKKTFTIQFKNEIEYLYVVASYQESLFPVKYTGKFTLSDIKKVGLFRDYESIDECLFEIFEGLNSNPSLTEKDSLNIIIIVPLHTRKYPEITFTLSKIEKKESQKYDELINALLNMKNEKDKEIKELKDKVEKLEKLLSLKNEKNENKEGSEEKFDGTKIEIFNIGKNEYLDYFPYKSQNNENLFGVYFSVALDCDEKDIKDIVDTFNKYKENIKELFSLKDTEDLIIRINKNKIIFDLLINNEIKNEKENQNKKDIFDEFHQQALFFSTANGMKLLLKTKINLINITENKDEEFIDNLIYNTNLNFKGDNIIFKIFISLLTMELNNNSDNRVKKYLDLVTDIFLTIINGNMNYSFDNKEILYDLKTIKKELLTLIKSYLIKGINMFKDQKYRIFQKINFNKIKIGLVGSPKFKVGVIGINFESPKNNEFIDKVLNGKITLEEDKNKEDENKEEINEVLEDELKEIKY